MVALAWWYADENEAPEVPHVMEEDGCANFISWVLWEGRYEEHGDESWPALNYRNDDVWHHRCNDCPPRRSFTWGAARNWNIYEKNCDGRVRFLRYMSDLLLSDVFKMDFDTYGDPPESADPHHHGHRAR